MASAVLRWQVQVGQWGTGGLCLQSGAGDSGRAESGGGEEGATGLKFLLPAAPAGSGSAGAAAGGGGRVAPRLGGASAHRLVDAGMSPAGWPPGLLQGCPSSISRAFRLRPALLRHFSSRWGCPLLKRGL